MGCFPAVGDTFVFCMSPSARRPAFCGNKKSDVCITTPFALEHLRKTLRSFQAHQTDDVNEKIEKVLENKLFEIQIRQNELKHMRQQYSAIADSFGQVSASHLYSFDWLRVLE